MFNKAKSSCLKPYVKRYVNNNSFSQTIKLLHVYFTHTYIQVLILYLFRKN